MAVVYDDAELAAVIVQALLYGAYVVLFVLCLWALFYRRSTPTVNLPMLVTSCLLFFFVTFHLAIDWSRARDGFVKNDSIAFGALIYYAKINHYKHVMKGVVFTCLTTVADALAVYRLYVVWHRKVWIIIFPILIVLATFAVGIVFSYQLTQIEALSSSLLFSNLEPYISSFYGMTLFQNLLTTGLISFRIWQSNKAVSRYSGQSLWPAIIILVESGALYCATIVVILALYACDLNMQFVMMDAAAPIIGITFSLIIIRVAMGVSRGGTFDQSNIMGPSTNPFGKTARHSSSTYPLTSVNVKVTRELVGTQLDHPLSNIKNTIHLP